MTLTTKQKQRLKNARQSGPVPNSDRRRASQIPRVSGSGGYFTDSLQGLGRRVQEVGKKTVPSGTFANIGEGLGSRFGPLGSMAGKFAGNLISNIAGFGDYSIKSNSLSKVVMGHQAPTFGNLKDRVRVRHREFIGDITAVGGTTFTVLSFPVNPGMAVTFPWLSAIAPSWDQYILKGMVFEFISTFSDISTGGALGSVVLAADYDALDTSFANKIVMENAQYSVSGKPSTNLALYIECDPSITQIPIKNVRNLSTSSDLRSFDWANFQVATVGLPVSSGNIGELWVSYDIEFLKPQLTEPVSTLMDHFELPTTVSSSHYFGADTTTTNNPVATSSLGGSTKNSTYTFPATARLSDLFMVTYQVTGVSTTLTTAVTFTLVGCSTDFVFNATGSSSVTITAGAVAASQIAMLAVKLTAPGATIAIAGGTLPASVSGGDLFVTRITVAN